MSWSRPLLRRPHEECLRRPAAACHDLARLSCLLMGLCCYPSCARVGGVPFTLRFVVFWGYLGGVSVGMEFVRLGGLDRLECRIIYCLSRRRRVLGLKRTRRVWVCSCSHADCFEQYITIHLKPFSSCIYPFLFSAVYYYSQRANTIWIQVLASVPWVRGVVVRRIAAAGREINKRQVRMCWLCWVFPPRGVVTLGCTGFRQGCRLCVQLAVFPTEETCLFGPISAANATILSMFGVNREAKRMWRVS